MRIRLSRQQPGDRGGDVAARPAGFAARTPVGRIGTPDDVADAIEYRVGNSFTSGVVLRVDGGARLGSTA
jgi:NAD(P)-dependent dehydrogenase (short-subunit alcohol dehydrogenase family)